MSLRKEQLWKIYAEKNPHWLTEGAKLTPDGLKKLFEQTFDRGHELGLANGRALEKKSSESSSSKKKVGDIFEEMFE